jgi:hypothetical protein
MRYLFIVLIASVFIQTTEAKRKPKYNNAGVTAYSVVDNKVYILLGEDERADGRCFWMNFVGGKKRTDKRDYKKTAFREFWHEETREVFDSLNVIRQIEQNAPVQVNKVTFIWLIEVDYIEPEIIKKSKPESEDFEMLNYCWVPAEELLTLVDKAPDRYSVILPEYCKGNSNRLHYYVYDNMRKGTYTRKAIEKLIKEHNKL